MLVSANNAASASGVSTDACLASALGLDVPLSLQQRADEIVE
jgi:hypothetical protein